MTTDKQQKEVARMSVLWRKKTDFKRLDEEWEDITEILPYERLYETLTPKQLRELLRDAKRFHWQALDLHRCGLKNLPSELGELTDLQVLDLGNGFWRKDNFKNAKWNSFSVLPSSFSHLINLQYLWLNDSSIAVLPDSFGNLSNLQRLYFSGSLIAELPDSIGNLPNLQRLSLYHMPITTLPISLGNLSKLHRLSLDNTPITVLPDSFGNLSNLQRLDLDNTQITTLPDFFGNFSNLQELSLSSTPITALPDSFRNLSNLKMLILRDTQITALPDFIGNFSNLRWLDLNNTQITALPASFGNLSNLKWLSLQDTPLHGKLPPEIRYHSPQKVIRYILAMQSNAPKRYFNETKMVVLGQGSVGKSCLINRLIHKRYENQHSTEGIDIESWDFSGIEAGRADDNDTYRLNVWDFGGQEIYHATHQFFLTHRTLYVLMWDALTEEEYGRRDYWMRTIRSFAGDSPVIIAVNKCDKDLGRYPQTEYAFLDKYPQILNRDRVFYISCRDNIGIDDLRNYILSEAVKMPLMKTEWLEKWLNVRNDLETLSKRENYIHYDEYLKICEKRGVRDEEEARMLIQYLHDLGVIIHYHDDELLCGIVILSPEWGTDAVYKVLDEQQRTLKGRNGILRYEDLPKIWNGKRYPRRMYPYLLKLMEKFQLAFQVDNPKLPENTYLVAELLSENPMPHDWPSEGAEPLAFRYDYDFMPAGVMTRLIVSIHQYLEDIDGVKQCWRKGAYLVRGSAHAKLVLYDGIDRKYLDIRVIGQNPRERSELLTVIREHVKGINSRFQKIEITELIPCKCSVGCQHFFKYDTLLKAEAKGHPDVECPETLERVPVGLLLDGIQKTPDDKRREAKYSGMNLRVEHMEGGNIIMGSQVGENAEVHATHEEVKREEESTTKPTPVERAEIRNYGADTRLKNLWFLVALCVLLAAGYLLITHDMTIREFVDSLLGNLPG